MKLKGYYNSFEKRIEGRVLKNIGGGGGGQTSYFLKVHEGKGVLLLLFQGGVCVCVCGGGGGGGGEADVLCQVGC